MTGTAFQGSTYDGYREMGDSTYNGAWACGSGDGNDNTTTTTIGQWKESGLYEVFRAWLIFDTSSIPDNAIVTEVKLSFRVNMDQSTTDFNLTVQSGMPDYPHIPIVGGDYAKEHYSGNYGYLTTVGLTLGVKNITLTSDAHSLINKEGYTKWCLRSSRDIAGNEPTGNEYISILLTEAATDIPVLYVTYYVQYTFHGILYEETGLLVDPEDRNCTVTAYYEGGISSQTFYVNGSYLYNTTAIPLYFHFELGTCDRQYWLDPSEDTATIYIFNASLTGYSVQFLDLTGALQTYPFVLFQRYVNGSLKVVEKRKVDTEKKVSVSLVENTKYNIEIGNGGNYAFGDVLFTSVTSVTLTLKGLEFPENIIIGYRYVRVHAWRDIKSGSIILNYEDTLDKTNSVFFTVYYQANNTVAYTANTTSSTWVCTWNDADNQTDYFCKVVVNHQTLNIITYNQVLPRLYQDGSPWGLDVLGTLPFDTSVLIPAFMVLAVAGGFSALNVRIGLFAAVALATALTYLGWLPLSPEILVIAWALAILFALTTGRGGTHV